MTSLIKAPLLAALAVATASAAIAQSNAGAPPATAADAPLPPGYRPMTVPPPPPPPQPAPAVATSADADVHLLRPAFVPWVATALDMNQSSDPIWVKGDRPASNIIARLVLKPAETVVVEQDAGQGAGKKLVLLRALAGDPTRYRTMRSAAGPQRIYCADGAALGEIGRTPCFEDRDGDRVFESRIYGLGETGTKAEQLSILAKPLPLAAPLRYRQAEGEEKPAIEMVVSNCGKDHDRPRYSLDIAKAGPRDVTSLVRAMSASPGSPEARQLQSELNNALARSPGICQAAEKVREDEPLHPGRVPDGGAVARLGELVIAIGTKEEGAPVRLLGLREPERLYRLSYGAVLPASDAPTTRQRALALQQKFDRPVLLTAGSAAVQEGRRVAGDTILTAGFRHGYMGVLSADTVIRTLFSKRSLPKGTLLYGVPMATRTVMTMRGLPPMPRMPLAGIPDPEEVKLVWCVPVQDAEQWTATCLPHQGAAERYTLLKGQRPAFEVTGFTYSAGMSTNDGDVPVVLQDGDFGKPLAWRFKIKEINATGLVLLQETLFGEAVVSSKDVRIPRIAGHTSAMTFADGATTFEAVEGAPDALMVKQLQPVRIGAEPRLTFGIVDMARLRGLPSPPVAPAPATTPTGN